MRDDSHPLGFKTKEILSRLGVSPSKKLGQNFLQDKNMAESIVSYLDCHPSDVVVEVGAGCGALSEKLYRKVKKLFLIEYDSRLCSFLEDRFKNEENVEVILGDAAQISLSSLHLERGFKLIGNFPYSSGSAILRNFLREVNLKMAVCMFQKEFASRLVALPRTKDYGSLTLLIQKSWNCKRVKNVSPTLFFPRPKVNSSIILFLKKEKEKKEYSSSLFDSLVLSGFSQRRKQLRNLLPSLPSWEKLTQSINVPLSVRAEDIDYSQWVKLVQWFEKEQDL